MQFDYIIVGAGSAGCVLADRLTATGKHRVLLLEAGGDDRRFFVQMPLGYGKTFYDKSCNWMYQAEPDPGLNGQRDYYPRGKILGGSSSINAMVYIRGQAQDYEDWKAAGNTGWGWDDVLPVYLKMEDYAAGDPKLRGRGGPVHITDLGAMLTRSASPFSAAAQAAGLAYTPDFNGARQEGVGLYQFTTKGGRRLSAARAFLRPAMKRKNLRVETEAQVTRILFEGARATGVEYGQRGQTLKASAHEVILAGGAINSPQLLQLSGIGPGALLQSLGIGVLRDNPNVGARMQDHHGINYTWRMKVPTLNDALRPWWGKLRAGMQYILTQRGPLSLERQSGRRLLPHVTRSRTPQHAALHAGLLDADPEGRRAPLAHARSVSGPVAGPLQLQAHQHRRGDDQVERSLRASEDIVQRLLDRERCCGDAGCGEVPAGDRRAGAAEIADGRGTAARTSGDERRRADQGLPPAQRHGLSPVLHLPHGAGRRRRRSSIRACACTAFRACASAMRPSSPISSRATPTRHR